MFFSLLTEVYRAIALLLMMVIQCPNVFVACNKQSLNVKAFAHVTPPAHQTPDISVDGCCCGASGALCYICVVFIPVPN